VDALGNRTTFGYDSAGRLQTVEDPLGNVTTSIRYPSAPRLWNASRIHW